MTTYQVGDVAETNDGRLAFVAEDDGTDLRRLRVVYEGIDGDLWLSRNGIFNWDNPDNRLSLRRLVWRDASRAAREAQAKREQAAKLLAEADALEQSV